MFSLVQRQGFVQNQAFLAFAITAVLLSLNVYVLWAYSSVVRRRTKTTPNPEDTTTVSTGFELAAADPPEVARVLRAHTNSVVNTLPFLVLALTYVLLGAPPAAAWILFGGFTLARLGYSWCYLQAVQPWRSLCYGLGGLFTLGVIEEVLRLALPALGG